MRIFTSLLILAIAGCATIVREPVTEIPAEVVVRGLDFSPYLERGFLITPKDYQGDHVVVGVIEVTVTPGAHREVETINTSGGKKEVLSDWIYEEASVVDAMEEAYSQSVEMGANGIMGFYSKSQLVEIERGYVREITVGGVAFRRVDD